MTICPPDQPSFGTEFDFEPKLGLFLAVLPDAGATDCATRLMARLHDDKTMLGKPVAPDRLHATLLYLAMFADQMPPSLIPAVRTAMTTVRGAPVDVVLDRVGGTGKRLLLRGSDGSPGLKALQQSLKVALIEAGLRRYIHSVPDPHVTLSYASNDILERPINPIVWTAWHFVLIESRLGKHQHVERGRWSIRNDTICDPVGIEGGPRSSRASA
jgi:RNA 2',3'-cyclic 3'-phosphodiesterase